MRPENRFPIAIAVFGILVEMTAIFLLTSKRIPENAGLALVIAGMFLAFVPVFVLSRRRRR